jgi:hypothetical protein
MSDWNPDDPALKFASAPHETCGLMRFHRSGRPSKEIMSTFRLKGTQFIGLLQKEKEMETEATNRGRDIHDPVIPKEKS